MDLLTRAELEELATPGPEGSHVSLFLPTHRFGRDVEADRLSWKNTLTSVESVLADRGVRRPDVEALLAPAWALHQDPIAWQHMSDGLAVLLRPGWHATFRVPVSLPALAAVGDRFVVSPLLPLVSGDQRFLLLAVSQQQVRLLEGTRHTVDELVLTEVPTNLRDVVEPPESRSDTMTRATSPGRSGPAVFYGHGAGDDSLKQDEIERFLRQVADGLDPYLARQDLPLVLMGLDQMVSTYRDVTSYAHVMQESVRHNPDNLSADELHAAAWPVVEQRLGADKARVVGQFEELLGTGRASAEPGELEEAAAQGRVDTLLVAAHASCWDEVAASSGEVLQLGSGGPATACDQLERIAVDTLTRSGKVYTFFDTPVPGGADVAAVFRY